MKIAVVGGGPAGLYLSILLKRQDPSHEIVVYERNAAGSTYGWGVTYWAGLLDKLRAGDPESAAAVADASVTWTDGLAIVRDERTVHRGDAGFGIGRRRMLGLLADRAGELGVEVVYEHPVDGPDAPELADANLVVAADGVHSALREAHPDHYGSAFATGGNPYIWLGTTKVFDSFSFAFKETAHGWIWCYAYGFSGERSTCVVECAPATWTGLGLDTMAEADCLALLEKLFHDLLDGHELIGRDRGAEPAQWLRFRTLTTRVWHRGRTVLLGDAAHTTHYSIGAGTTLALEDALALAEALRDRPGDPASLDAALAAYGRRRRAALVSAQSAARLSARWYENLPRYMALAPDRMFALLGQRHSPLLPYVPPQLYYRVDRAVGRLESLRRLKRWLGPRVARAVHRA
ncbi:FAD-dependent monooxygenase [Streptomyces hydrogenans]|uniref:FAD-binding monooxygenase n=1 Tax=Streptomyces hydrogenans TaxID=1873719 RepID=A0ABQ3PDI6_9ACTN|nr:FAD-dependent monooxygenase [Streptomyces hydrogenans]GHG21400.1 FAD-binding monooxygenase [Streptomyces hydrogenans]GHI23093.1 FAD-binding monooxygenase [Streptomyces hydrogenans]